ncbi:MAG: cytochrome c oxidase subunit II [Wenzhouxiangellaceae bacterium]|nr:cytochrome c oxidase subunit II [Wenzhouxiangellaceae bacterium]
MLESLADILGAVTDFGARVDALFLVMLAASLILVAALVALVVGFCVRYRRGRGDHAGPRLDHRLEYGWSLALLAVFLGFFAWGAWVYVDQQRVPDGTLQIRAVAKQWMWKFHHPGGQREINHLHVPAGRPVEIVLASEDVIHSFYVPAFRLKQDAVPGRYTRTWFEADAPGVHRLFCAEYCGTQHSRMRGTVTVLSPDEYAQWLAERTPDEGLAEAGARLYSALGCSGCHEPGSQVHAPGLRDLYGRPVALASGETVIADEAYLRDAILLPEKHVVAGFDPVMPSFSTQIEEADLMRLIAWLRAESRAGGNDGRP